MERPSQIIQPGTVSQRVQQINETTGYQDAHPRKHKSFARSNQYNLTVDYRSRLRHVEPRSFLRQRPHFHRPHLRHFHRPSIERRGCHPLVTSDSGSRRPSSLREFDRSSPERCTWSSDEISTRIRKRPYLQHICGHYDQAVTVTVPGDDTKSHLIEEGAPGSLIVVGPRLQSSVLGPRLQSVMEEEAPFTMPFPCSLCKRHARLLSHSPDTQSDSSIRTRILDESHVLHGGSKNPVRASEGKYSTNRSPVSVTQLPGIRNSPVANVSRVRRSKDFAPLPLTRPISSPKCFTPYIASSPSSDSDAVNPA